MNKKSQIMAAEIAVICRGKSYKRGNVLRNICKLSIATLFTVIGYKYSHVYGKNTRVDEKISETTQG